MQINYQLKKKHRSAFAKKQTGHFSRQTIKPLSVPASSLSKLYTDCRVPLNIFLDCLFDKDYEGLILKGQPTEDEIAIAWNKIYSEYAEIVSNGSYNAVFELTREINELHYTILFIDGAIKHLLEFEYDAELIRLINTFNLRCDIKQDDSLEEITRKLKVVHNRAKSIVIRRQLKQVELDKLQEESKPESGRYQFYENLTILSKYLGLAVREKDITVIQYCRDLKRMENEYRLAQLKNQ